MIIVGDMEIEFHETEWAFELPADDADDALLVLLDSEEQAIPYKEFFPDGKVKRREVFVTTWMDA